MKNPEAIRELIVVSGMPRSGTTLMMRVLWESGADVIADEKISFECMRTNTMDKESAWLLNMLAGNRPPVAIKALYPHVLELPNTLKVHYILLWMTRNPKEQAKSQRRLRLELGMPTPRHFIADRRKTIPIVNTHAMTFFRDQPNVTVEQVPFERFLRREPVLLNRIGNTCGLVLDTDAIANRRVEYDPKRKFGELEVANLKRDPSAEVLGDSNG